jgi:hypothetical protein
MALEKVTIKTGKASFGGQLPHLFLDSPLPVLITSLRNLKEG